MKVSVFGITEFPLGKKVIPDERLDKIEKMLHPAKTTYIQLELMDEQAIKDADAIISLNTKKTDLILLDLELIETRLSRIEDGDEKIFLLRIQAELEKENFLNELNLSEAEAKIAGVLNFITSKPILLLDESNIHDTALAFKKIFAVADMISFFTAGQKELKAWPLRQGLTAYDAAGCVHSDIQRGFIKAEVYNFKDVEEMGGLNQAKTRAMRLEDKGYVVKDGDILNFRFNV
jgi:ribosome-binding ATPase YchF (GTP1/OBG family)